MISAACLRIRSCLGSEDGISSTLYSQSSESRRDVRFDVVLISMDAAPGAKIGDSS